MSPEVLTIEVAIVSALLMGLGVLLPKVIKAVKDIGVNSGMSHAQAMEVAAAIAELRTAMNDINMRLNNIDKINEDYKRKVEDVGKTLSGHEKDCAQRNGRIDEKLMVIESTLSKIESNLTKLHHDLKEVSK